MKTLHAWILALMLVGCGQVGQSPSEEEESSAAQIAEQNGAQYYVHLADVPSCDESRDRQLIYVKEMAHFEYCDQGAWVIIDTRGAQGEKGEKGDAGDDGVQGVAGQNGRDGRDGKDGDDGSIGKAGRDGTLNSLVWIHPVDGSRWFVGNYFMPNLLVSASQTLCPTSSSSPTNSEFSDAIAAGLWAQVGPAISASTLTNTLGGVTVEKAFILGQVTGSSTWAYDFKVGNKNGSVVTGSLNSYSSNALYAICVAD